VEGLQVVLEGHEPDGTEWSVLAGPDESNEGALWTFVRRSRPGGRPAQSGMGGPKLHGDNVVNVWAGRSDGTPSFILVRGIPSIEDLTVTTRSGVTLSMHLSPLIEAFGLRFGAAALPEDDEPQTLIVRLIDGRVVTGDVPWPRRPRFGP